MRCESCGRELGEDGYCQNEACSAYAMGLLRKQWDQEDDSDSKEEQPCEYSSIQDTH